MLQKNCHFDSKLKLEQFRTFCLLFWPWSWKGFQILRCLQLSHPCCKPKPVPGDCFLWPQKFGTAGIMWAAAIIPGVNLTCALVVTWSTWSHCGSTFGCGEVLCFLTNKLGDDVAVLKILHLQKMAETFAEWEDRRSHQAVPLQDLRLQWLLPKASRRSQLWLLEALGEKLWQ
jgi:hypothetical protein